MAANSGISGGSVDDSGGGSVGGSVTSKLQDLLARFGIAGTSVAVLDGTGSSPIGVSAGVAVKSAPPLHMTPKVWLQQASLSKTVASCFAIEYFNRRGISMDAPVNSLLARTDSSYRLKPGPGCPGLWAEQVKLYHLVNHTALGMHYVYGIPRTRAGGMPTAHSLLEGIHAAELGYEQLLVEKEPGSKFAYSGGGFLVLQHLLEEMEHRPIETIMRTFLDECSTATRPDQTRPDQTEPCDTLPYHQKRQTCHGPLLVTEHVCSSQSLSN